MGRIYHPNMAAFLTVALDSDDPAADDPITFETRVHRASWTANDHNHADELEIEAEWNDAGIDPRILSSGLVEFHLGGGNDLGEGHFWTPQDKNERFLGRIVETERSSSENGVKVRIRAHDYTSFFLAAKPVATAAVPLMSDTLATAWARLCDNIPGCKAFRDRLRFLGLTAPGPVLAKAVAARFARIGGKIPVKPGTDAWAIWQQAVGMLGLISWIELDTCVVATATDYYSGEDPPRLLWGENIAEMTERRNSNRDQKPVLIQSFDPLSGKTLEAKYDGLAEAVEAATGGASRSNVVKPRKASKGRVGAKPAGAAPTTSAAQAEAFQFAGVTDQGTLDKIAERVYEERSRQALEGTIRTAEMILPTVKKMEFDLLSLRSGDTIEVRFADTADQSMSKTFDNAEDRATWLELRGYQPPVARLLANTIQRLGASPNLMYVKSVRAELSTTKDGGSFSVEISYCAKIDPRGGTDNDNPPRRGRDGLPPVQSVERIASPFPTRREVLDEIHHSSPFKGGAPGLPSKPPPK